jgi:hypothetical protein
MARHYVLLDKTLFCVTAYAVVLLLELEIYSVYLSLARSRSLFEFYDLLDKRRSSRGELVKSYRHLREHGNSFFIVFLEIALAVVLFQTQKIVPAKPTWYLEVAWLAALAVWIAPAVFVWLISTIFERRFRDS